ncbi:response regulator transcription factor [Sphingomonas sp. CGMCC 1.13654]|uniref:Response regulator transcription factor n=1 Tax=Sphingomonas chungangi TaxID=2683589 RepID=A0A838L8I3_9SPHN|nr:response regulator transcription factor [Sphingomonas chungangi]MBA2934985.1 response regulator transcription factor [Sphingomonas chungangi]MVW58295.1 response regulator [Sphingomonas chungangi]
MSDRRLLIVEDDEGFARTLGRSFEKRGYVVRILHAPEGLTDAAADFRPHFAVLDLRLGHASGLACVQALHDLDPGMRIVVLTGFASIATAVEAIKLGATNYLTKPSDTDDIERAFAAVDGNAEASLAARPSSIKTIEWEHIHQVLADTGFNISETARRLGMHRRTLARKLGKRHV